jgi:hypothetical protein
VYSASGIKVLNSPTQHFVEFEALKGMLRRVVEEVEADIKQVERELAEARRVGAKRRAEELSAIRGILYEDKWFRIATAVYVYLKKLFAEDGKAAEVIEAARSRLFGLRLEVVEVPLLKIEAAVDREGKAAAVRCRAALDVGVEAVFEGTAPGYKLEKTAQAGETTGAGRAAEKTATGVEAAVSAVRSVSRRRGGGEGGGVERRGAAGRGVVSTGGGGLERVLEEVRREFSGLPVYVGVEDGYVYVKRTAPMDKRQFKKYTEACRRLGFRFDRRGERWIKPLEELKTT